MSLNSSSSPEPLEPNWFEIEPVGTPVLPDGYVYVADREYPLASTVGPKTRFFFDKFVDKFVDPFLGDSVVCDINPVAAIMSGVELHNSGRRMVQGIGINQYNDSRTVATILDMDFDASNTVITRFFELGAIVGPFMLLGSGKPFYSSGVGLWLEPKLFTNQQ